MSDVFVSYKAEDRRRVGPLVDALEADGFSVWWDAQIGGGDAWREAIESELDQARCVIVVWSKRSVGRDGHFVKDEAARAQQRGTYLPVLLDKVRPPLGFGETQGLSIVGWKGDRASAKYAAVAECARSIMRGEKARPRPATGAWSDIDRRTLVGGGSAAVVAAAAGGWFLLNRRSPGAAESIAVLPFANLSGDPAQAYFSDGIAEELRSALGRVRGLKVIGRTSSEMVRNSDAVAAASRLRVANVVTGSVRRSTDLIRIAAQLVSGEDGVERWSQVYDRPPGDILAIQSEIAKNVADALSLELGGSAGGGRIAGGTDDAQAHDLYLRAVAIKSDGHNESNFRQAAGLLDEAIKLDPDFADAYAQKADTVADLTGIYANDAAEFDRGYEDAAKLARRAIALTPKGALGHAALATALAGKLDVRGALAEYHCAAELDAGEVDVLSRYSLFMAKIGHSREALDAADKGIPLDPLNPRPYAMRGSALFYARRYEDAADAFRQVIKIARVPPALAYTALGNCLTMLGRIPQARDAFAHAPADNVYRLTGEAIIEARNGQRAAAERILERLREKFGDSAIYQQAEVQAQLGQRAQAFAALDRSLEVRDPGLLAMRADPFLDPLRGDPRFGGMERRLGLPAA